MGGPDNTRWRNHLPLTPAQERQARRMLAEGDPHRGSQGARGVQFDVVPPAPAERFSVTRRSSAQHRGREPLELLGGYRAPDLPGGGIRGRSRAGRPRRAPFRVLGPVGRTRMPRHGCAGHRHFRRRAARCWLGRSGCHGCLGPSRDGQRVGHLHLYAVARSSLNRRSRRCTIRASVIQDDCVVSGPRGVEPRHRSLRARKAAGRSRTTAVVVLVGVSSRVGGPVGR